MTARITMMVLAASVLFTPVLVNAGDDVSGKPFKNLQRQIDELKRQDEIMKRNSDATGEAILQIMDRYRLNIQQSSECVSGILGVLGEVPEDCIGDSDPPGPQESKYVFVSSTQYTGNLGGLQGADAKCQQLATTAGLPGVYKAWLSDVLDSPNTRFTKTNHRYKLVNDAVIASNWADLTDGLLNYSVQIDEYGNPLADIMDLFVWTGTTVTGHSLPAEIATQEGLGKWHTFCFQWTQEVFWVNAIVGSHWFLTELWSNTGDSKVFPGLEGWPCDEMAHLYCFQQ